MTPLPSKPAWRDAGERPLPNEVDPATGLRYLSAHGQGRHRRSDEATARRALAQGLKDVGKRHGEDNAAQWLRREAESLVESARKEGYLIDPSSVAELIGDREDLGESEHQVYPFKGEGRVLKITLPPNFGARGNAASYLDHIDRVNAVLHDSIRFVGVVESPAGPAIVISQPYIEGTRPTEAEVTEWFEQQGYKLEGYNKWRHPQTGAVLADAHTGNFILTADGVLVPIDLQVLATGEETKTSSSLFSAIRALSPAELRLARPVYAVTLNDLSSTQTLTVNPPAARIRTPAPRWISWLFKSP